MRYVRRPIGVRQVHVGGLADLQVDHVRGVLQYGHRLLVGHLLQGVVVYLCVCVCVRVRVCVVVYVCTPPGPIDRERESEREREREGD